MHTFLNVAKQVSLNFQTNRFFVAMVPKNKNVPRPVVLACLGVGNRVLHNKFERLTLRTSFSANVEERFAASFSSWFGEAPVTDCIRAGFEFTKNLLQAGLPVLGQKTKT